MRINTSTDKFNYHKSSQTPNYSKDSFDSLKSVENLNSSNIQTIEEVKTLVQAIQIGVSDPIALTNLIFYARHPKTSDKLLKNNQSLKEEWQFINKALVHPTLDELGLATGGNIVENGEKINIRGYSNYQFDSVIHQAIEWCPGLSPQILKGLLAQESNFDPKIINSYGYAGIAQFGKSSAREVGLKVGISGTISDERLDPNKAIPAAARLLDVKAKRLKELAFSKYGLPKESEYWKFVLAAYNGGEATVSLAMGNAYRVGAGEASSKGLIGVEVVKYAQSYACQWGNLLKGGMDSPLGWAVFRYFPKISLEKYREIGSYPLEIFKKL